jgi:uncharacterized protein (TIGR00369 family)
MIHAAPSESLSYGTRIPFINLLGIQLRLFEGGESRLEYDPKPEHLNSFSVVHGGALMTLLDVTMATAARSVDKEMGVVTVEMKTSFMRAVKGPLKCHGQIKHRTATLAFVEATAYDEQGRACAHATGTFKYMRRLPTGPGSVSPLNPIPTD